MEQQPPPYSGEPSTSTAQYPTKPVGPQVQQGYAANPGYPPTIPQVTTTTKAVGPPMHPGYPVNPGYPPTTPQVTTSTTQTFVHQKPPSVIMSPGNMFQQVPISMQCPMCRSQIVTATEYEPGALSWLACFGLAALGCVFGCCFIPFCIDDMKDVTHKCPSCQTTVGVYRRM